MILGLVMPQLSLSTIKAAKGLLEFDTSYFSRVAIDFVTLLRQSPGATYEAPLSSVRRGNSCYQATIYILSHGRQSFVANQFN